MTPFSELLAQASSPNESGNVQVELTADWLQGRAAFGGLMSALAMTALRSILNDDRPLRALMTAFVGPPGPGIIDITCTQLRSGKSVTWAEIKISQNGNICTTLTACLGGERESRVIVDPPVRPLSPLPNDCVAFPYIEGMTPVFIQHFDIRWAIGGLPMSASSSYENGAWVRFKDPGAFGESHIVALMDLLPPAVLQMFRSNKPVSSLTWHLEMLDELRSDDLKDGEGWWFFHVYAQGAGNGYSQEHATLFSPKGRAVAMSQQSVAIFA